MTTLTPQQDLDTARVEEFAEQVGRDQNVGIAGVLAYIGDRLGIWATLAGAATFSSW